MTSAEHGSAQPGGHGASLPGAVDAGSPAAVDAGLLGGVRSGAATSDVAVLQALLDAEAALIVALAETGLAPATAVSDVAAAARADRFDVISIADRARSSGNPVVPLVADLTAAVPERSVDFVHRGATSQDIVDTGLMLVAARVLGPMLADLDRLAARLAVLASEHRDTVMAARTLTQHAVPTTFGLKVAGWRALTLDARDRLAGVAVGLPVQLGGAGGTLAAYGDNGRRMIAAFARATGLAEPDLPWHTLRTPIADLAGALAFTAGALGKLAADVLVLARTEIGEVSENAGGGSSAMPHKANPVRATLVAAAARQAPALAATLLGAVVAEDERPAGAWHAEWEPLRDLLRLVGGATSTAPELVDGLVVDPDRMRANLDRTAGAIMSEKAVVQLTGELGARAARSRVDQAVRRSAADGIGLRAALGMDFDDRPETYLGSAAALVDAALRRTAK